MNNDMNIIHHNKPSINGEEIQAATQVLQSNWLIGAKITRQFERDFKQYMSANYAIAVTNGTSALHLSLLALGIKMDDEIITATYTASDILNAIFYVGGKPVLADSENNTCTISLEDIDKKITPKTKAMIIPHMFGFPVEINRLKQYGIPIIEDCAQTLGSTYQNTIVGSKSLISIFSFFASKLIATGQGGMITTDSEDLYRDIRDLIDYNGRDNYRVRYNYPMTDIMASIGCEQLKKFPFFARRRKLIAENYQYILEKKGIPHFPKRKDTNVVPFRFLLQGKDLQEILTIKQKFQEQGIETKLPIEPYELLHRLLGQNRKQFPNAESFAQTVLSLPMYPALKDNEVERIGKALKKVL
jgi:perosamine synthetase